MQKSCTERKGLYIPMKKDTMSVTDVMVMETAASERQRPIRSGTGKVTGVFRQAANITNVSSIPTPATKGSR